MFIHLSKKCREHNLRLEAENNKLRKQLCTIELWAKEMERRAPIFVDSKALNFVNKNEVEVSNTPEETMTELDVKESRQHPVRNKNKGKR